MIWDLIRRNLATGFCRTSISNRRRKWYWIALLAGVLMTHLAAFGFFATNLTEPQILTGFVVILARDLAGTLPGRAFAMHVLSAMLILGCYMLASRRFERIEIPTQKGPLRYVLGDWTAS